MLGRQLGDAYHEGSGVPVANRERAVGAQATWRGPPVRRAYDGTGAEAPLQTRRGGDGTPRQNQAPSPRCAAFARLGWPLSRNWFCFPSKFALALISLSGEVWRLESNVCAGA